MGTAAAAASWIALASGCPAPADDTDGSASASSTSAGDDGWFEVGWGITEFNELEDGDDLGVVWGTQGAAMFPLPLRGGGFVLPEDPSDYESPLAPKLELHMDIEGHNDGIGGHFLYIANYPITFEIKDDGSYEFLFVAAVIPDAVDPLTLEGLTARLWVELQPYESQAMEHELELVVRNGEVPE